NKRRQLAGFSFSSFCRPFTAQNSASPESLNSLVESNSKFLLYAGILAGGFWAILWLIKRWALVPTEITISASAVVIETLATAEALEIPFSTVLAYRFDGWQLVLRLRDGSKVQYQVNYKFYNPSDFWAMSQCLKQALLLACGPELMREKIFFERSISTSILLGLTAILSVLIAWLCLAEADMMPRILLLPMGLLYLPYIAIWATYSDQRD
ncbi:MAG: hypothetical protein ACRYG7_17285, partial [Janthinobacterium lividum]